MQGYKKLGFSREGNTIVYREWAPAAGSVQLIGDFNNWNGSWMERDEFGVWKITLPDGETPAMPVSENMSQGSCMRKLTSLAISFTLVWESIHRQT